MRLPIVPATVLLLAACGGGGTGNPSPVAGMTLVSADPPPGSTVTLMRDSNGFARVDVTLTLSVVSDKTIESTAAGVEWIAGETRCGSTVTPIFSVPNLKALQAQTIRIPPQDVIWRCPLPLTTSSVRVDVSEFSFCCSGPSFSRELALSYRFVD